MDCDKKQRSRETEKQRCRNTHFLAFFSASLLLCLSASILLSPPAHALPLKGFYRGPYLTLSGGILQFDWDVNQNSTIEEGSGWEPMVQLGFGWNLFDWFAPELEIRFTTDQNGGRREYIAGANLGFVFTGLIKPLLSFKSLRILPFIKPGFAFQLASLPGDRNASDNRVSNFGAGTTMGAGLRFLFNEYLYFGLEANQYWIFHPNKMQMIGHTNTLIYDGGFKTQFEALGMVGVHF